MRWLRLWLARWLCRELFEHVRRLEQDIRLLQAQSVKRARREHGHPEPVRAPEPRDARLFSRAVRQYTDDRGVA